MVNFPHFFKSRSQLEVLTNEQIDPNLALRIEQENLDPPETMEGIRFLLLHGNVLIAPSIGGIAESITLKKLLENTPVLPQDSPLKMILENDKRYGVLSSVANDYRGKDEYHYAHGIAVSKRGQGKGSELFRKRIQMIVGPNDLMFGFVAAEPLNLASLRMYLGNGAVLAGMDNNVYETGRRYFKLIYDKFMAYGRRVGTVPLDKGYLTRIAGSLNAGFIATKFEEPNSLVFNIRI